jgi:hypothetical protein
LLIVGSLDELKGKAQNLQSTIGRQAELLKKTNKRADENEARLRQQNNQLKAAIQKHKNGKQICLDMCLLITFVALVGVLVRMLKGKGYL